MIQKCSTHFGSLAGWKCTGCGATLCADCTGMRTSGAARFEFCSKCGALAAPLKIARGELNPFSASQLVRAIGWPVSPIGALSILACAGLIAGLSLLGAKASAIAVGATIAYLFQVVRHTAVGADDFPGPDDFRGYFEDVVAPSLRLAVALAWIWLPALAWNYFHRDAVAEPSVREAAIRQAMKPGGKGLMVRGMRVVSSPTGIEVMDPNAPVPEAAPAQQEAEQEAQAEEPPPPPPAPVPQKAPWVPGLLVLLGVLLAPMSLIASSLKTPLMIAANPIVLAGYAVKLGRDYLLLVGFCLAAAMAALMAQLFGHAIFGAGFVSRLPVNFLVLFVAFAAFRAIGLFVRARGGDLGYGDEQSYLVPVLGDAQPRYVVPEAKAVEPAAPPPPPQPIELSEPDPVGVFAQLIASGDSDGMVALLGKSGKHIPHTMMSANSWMATAQKAWAAKNAKAAAHSLKRCLDAEPQGPLAPRAWLLAARVYDEALADKATSEKLLRELVKRFPDSEQGKAAAARLQGGQERQ